MPWRGYFPIDRIIDDEEEGEGQQEEGGGGEEVQGGGEGGVPKVTREEADLKEFNWYYLFSLPDFLV